MLKVYPNAVDEMFKIERQGMTQTTLSITNSFGQTVHKSAFGAGEQNKELPFEDATAGAYFIRVVYPLMGERK